MILIVLLGVVLAGAPGMALAFHMPQISEPVTIALITAMFTTIGIAIATAPALITARGNKKHIAEIKDTVGTHNGRGNITNMLEQVLGRLEEQSEWQHEHSKLDDSRFGRSESMVTGLEAMLKSHLPLFEGLAQDLAELNEYSHEAKHDQANKLTALSMAVYLLWQAVMPDTEPPFDEAFAPPT